MNNKGFTLIELLVTLSLIAIISTIIVVNMTSIQINETSSNNTIFESQLTTAGCSYIDSDINNISRVKCKNGATCQIPLSTLIDEGLIDGETVDPNTNLKLNDERDAYYVNIVWDETNGYKEKTCSLVKGTASVELPTNTSEEPICKNPVIPTSYQIGSYTITYGCDDSSVNGCKTKDLTKKYTDSTKETLQWTIEDYYNIKHECSYYVDITFDTTDPKIEAKADPLSLGSGDYNFVDNVTATFGLAGGTVECKDPTSRKTGTYSVTCTATPNNNKPAVSTSFQVRHSYTASPQTTSYTYSCNCCDNCCVWTEFDGGTYVDPSDGSTHPGYIEHHYSCCKSTCTGYSTSYYCPNGGTLSGTTCNY